MKTIYDIVNEAKKSDSVYAILGSDDSIQSVWMDKNDADNECKKCNTEIGGNFFRVSQEKTSDFIEM
jgi:hypothetical protein